MTTKAETGSAVIEDNLHAGFVMSDEGGTKEFALFKVPDGPQSAQFVRNCTKEEKKRLKKKVYGQKIIRSIPCSPGAREEGFLLFVIK
jgi:hypothetical protein